MHKIFLFLYPIEEYTKMYLLSEDSLYDEWNIKRPLSILNECIQKRYRDNGYQIVFALYKDKKIYGLENKLNDKIIYSDITFDETSGIDKLGNFKKNFVPRYTNEIKLLNQLGKVDELVLAGYHAQDCVKRVANMANNLGITTLIDLDLTDYFFHLYKNNNYFKIEYYDPIRYQQMMYNEFDERHDIDGKEEFDKLYSSSIYGFELTKNIYKNI